jgi:hypothetical protein
MPNQFTKAKRLGLPVPTVSEETKLKLSKKSTEANIRRYKDPALRKRLSESMKKAVEKYPESYGASNRGRTKRIDKHGISFQGKWELIFFEWCLEAGLTISRASKGFPYTWEGERTYFPDFFIPDLNVYVEVKGYETERDRAKWRDFPHALIVVRRADIEKIKRKEFSLTAE